MEHAKSDEKGGVGFEKDVQKFTDNAEGTISLKEFLEQVGRYGERVAGNTGKRVYTGVQGMIDESTRGSQQGGRTFLEGNNQRPAGVRRN